MGPLRRFLDRLSESDESRLAEEIRSWASTVPGVVPLSQAVTREHVRIAGVIRRLTVFPLQGKESLEVVVFDGTGEAILVFMGRRTISGLSLGTRVVVEGVLGAQ